MLYIVSFDSGRFIEINICIKNGDIKFSMHDTFLE